MMKRTSAAGGLIIGMAVALVVGLLVCGGSGAASGPGGVEKAAAKPTATDAAGAAKASDLSKTTATPTNLTLDLGGGAGLKLVLIPAGTFMMGSPDTEQGRAANESPLHEVTITKPYYLGVTPVTQAQYKAVTATNSSGFKGPTNPVEMVSWDDVAQFCKKLSEKTGRTVRLPTEAEWEYACRAGTRTRFFFGDDEKSLAEHAWYGANGKTPHPVGLKKPNAWGLYDMNGNVWQWCADWYGDYPKGAVTDPQGPASGKYRVARGGGPFNTADFCRAACRNGTHADFRLNTIGFRVAVSAAASGN
jgi:formylglycine-generating enzyme required for sulfatase activity